jgi:hypothetical protein
LAAATHQLPLAGEEQEKGEAEVRPHLAPRLPRARVTSTDNAASVLQMLKRTCIAIAAAAVALAASAPGASAGGCQALQSLPPTTPDVVGLTLTPNPVVAGQTVQAHFSLDKPVPFEIPYFITKNGFNGITLSTTCIRMRPGDTGGSFTITTTTSIPTLPNFAEIMVSFTPLFSVLTPGQNWVDLQILPPSSPKPPPPPPPPPPSGTDTVKVTRAEWSAGSLRVEATSTNASATLTAYNPSSGATIGTLANAGGGGFRGQFTTPLLPKVEVRSSAGGSATGSVTVK